jgi:hypothetical protein
MVESSGRDETFASDQRQIGDPASRRRSRHFCPSIRGRRLRQVGWRRPRCVRRGCGRGRCRMCIRRPPPTRLGRPEELLPAAPHTAFASREDLRETFEHPHNLLPAARLEPGEQRCPESSASPDIGARYAAMSAHWGCATGLKWPTGRLRSCCGPRRRLVFVLRCDPPDQWLLVSVSGDVI